MPSELSNLSDENGRVRHADFVFVSRCCRIICDLLNK